MIKACKRNVLVDKIDAMFLSEFLEEYANYLTGKRAIQAQLMSEKLMEEAAKI